MIVPQVNDAAAARAIVRAAKYPPEGTRGVGIGRVHGYGARFAETIRTANARTCVVAQIEHVDGVACVEEIAAVQGLDALSPWKPMGTLARPRLHEIAAAFNRFRSVRVR